MDHQLELPIQYYRVGVKMVSDQSRDSGRSELQELAHNLDENVSLQIRTRGPFKSMNEFLAIDLIFMPSPYSTSEQGALETPIAAVPSINLVVRARFTTAHQAFLRRRIF